MFFFIVTDVYSGTVLSATQTYIGPSRVAFDALCQDQSFKNNVTFTLWDALHDCPVFTSIRKESVPLDNAEEILDWCRENHADAIAQGRKIKLVKAVRQQFGVSLRDAKYQIADVLIPWS